MSAEITRRSLLAGGAALAAASLAACSVGSRRIDMPSFEGLSLDGLPFGEKERASQFDPYYVRMYGPMPQERFPIPAVDLRRLKPTHFRTEVADPTGERPGTIVVSTAERYLYLVQENRRAIRYGVGIGRDGFTWDGRGEIGRKAAWPVWTPPAEMIQRQPELAEFRNGQPPGLDNPLGARALYIYRNGRDTIYRLHGTGETWTIGDAVSSGCVRLLHQDVIDLYGRVPVGARILVG